MEVSQVCIFFGYRGPTHRFVSTLNHKRQPGMRHATDIQTIPAAMTSVVTAVTFKAWVLYLEQKITYLNTFSYRKGPRKIEKSR